MDLQTIRDGTGKVIVKIYTLPNGDKRITDNSGQLLGRYTKAMNRTEDAYGRLIARCDCTMMFLKP